MAACPDDDSCYAVVCDGMGGANAGEVASDMAIKYISERLAAGWRKNMSNESVINLLTTAITAANICIFDKAAENRQLQGMGTTVVAGVMLGDRLVVAHAGDSRAYLFGEELTCLTKDHSFVQDLVDAGQITEEQAKFHPDKNYITRALGIEERIEIDFAEYSFGDKDKLLLCSDGLTNYVSEAEIAEILSAEDVHDTAAKLVAAANRNGGGDNVTAVVIARQG